MHSKTSSAEPNLTPEYLLENQKRLQAQGKRLLDETALNNILTEYGTLEVSGSYVYGLMSHPDLDLGVISDNLSKEHFGELLGKLASLPAVRRVKTSDRVTFYNPADGRPHGFWIGLELDFENELWSIDIWYQKPEWFENIAEKWSALLAPLTEEQRVAILLLKEELRAQGRYGLGKQHHSVTVYQAVLDANIRTVAELDALPPQN